MEPSRNRLEGSAFFTPIKIIDISAPISGSLPVYDGDPAPRVERLADVEQGAPYTLSRLELGAHTGTHMDAPLHFIRGGKSIDLLDLDSLVGPAQVVDMTDARQAIGAADLEAAGIGAAHRVLFKTSNSSLWGKSGFQKNYVGIAPDGAEWLVDRGVQLVGIDYLSIEEFGSLDFPTHHLLLGAGVVIVEGLVLKDVAPGEYHLVCLPICIKGAEGAPARAVLLQAEGVGSER